MNDRMRTLQDKVAAMGADLLVLNPGSSLTYLTGHAFDAHERLFLLLLPAKGKAVAVLPALEQDNWRHAVPGVDQIFLWEDKDGPQQAAAAAFALFDDAARVAVEPLTLRYMEVMVLQRHLPKAQLVAADAAIGALRLSKSADEAEKMRHACRITDEVLREATEFVRVGMTEKQVSGQLVSRMLDKGGEGISFGPIVLSGPKSALPHGVPDERQIAAGEFLLIDFGTSWHGYHSDITRTFVVGGEPSDRMRAVYETVLAGNRAGCAKAAAGVSAHDVHMAAAAPLLDPAFKDFYRHRTGHGLGLEIHEPPSVMEGNHDPLAEGTVITVEPGLYLEGWGGVRIEDDLWIRQGGADSLTAFPRQLQVIGQ